MATTPTVAPTTPAEKISVAPPGAQANVRSWARWLCRIFKNAQLVFGHGTCCAEDEAAWLITHVLNVSPDAYTHFLNQPLPSAAREELLQYAAARLATRKPLAYLLQEAWLCGQRFYVDERVLVPRSYFGQWIQEDMAIWLAADAPVSRALDMCTGSGCLAILLAQALPAAHIDAVDISSEALSVAQRNVRDYDLASRITLIASDLFAQLPAQTPRYDIIICNPPYVTTAAMDTLPPEYLAEPSLALAGGSDGMTVVRRLLTTAKTHLTDHGWIAVEIGHNRAEAEAALGHLPLFWPELPTEEDALFLIHATDLPG